MQGLLQFPLTIIQIIVNLFCCSILVHNSKLSAFFLLLKFAPVI